MSEARGIREIAYFDCAGGGQVVVDGGFAYVGHIDAPHGTTIIDVRDPKHPKKVAELTMPPGTHSHKVRVAKGLMIVNHEITDERLAGEYRGGLGIYDVGTPYRPREVARWETQGKGVHRFDFDGDYVYGSPTVDGYLGNIVMILDVREPSRPQEVGRWWMPGQWIAGGETPTWRGTMHRCHHPLRLGDRLYTSYWHGGFVILDIADMAHPRFVSGLDWSPPFPCPTHSAVPVPFEIRGRRMLVVSDEDVFHLEPGPPAFLWLVDITTDERPSSTGRKNSWERSPGRVVRPGPARPRHRESAPAARGRSLRPRRPKRSRSRLEQRRLHGRERLDLFDRSGPRIAHPRTHLRSLL